MNKLDQLKSIDPAILQDFLEKRNPNGIREELREYILQINAVPAIIHYKGASLTRVAQSLRRQFPNLTYAQARGIYEDAMNFFYFDDSVTSDAWDNYYAEQYDNLARLSIAMNKPDVAIKAFEKAHDLKVRATDRIKTADWAPPIFVISSKIKPEDLGYAHKSLYDIARKAEDGFYKKLIDNLPVSDAEKQRLTKEADIKDTDYEEITD